jgi:hypothetical protein
MRTQTGQDKGHIGVLTKKQDGFPRRDFWFDVDEAMLLGVSHSVVDRFWFAGIK